jgi:hypothetical protein
MFAMPIMPRLPSRRILGSPGIVELGEENVPYDILIKVGSSDPAASISTSATYLVGLQAQAVAFLRHGKLRGETVSPPDTTASGSEVDPRSADARYVSLPELATSLRVSPMELLLGMCFSTDGKFRVHIMHDVHYGVLRLQAPQKDDREHSRSSLCLRFSSLDYDTAKSRLFACLLDSLRDICAVLEPLDLHLLRDELTSKRRRRKVAAMANPAPFNLW